MRKMIKEKRGSCLKRKVILALDKVTQLPSYKDSPDEFTDWGLTGPYKVKTARGECAA